MNASNNAFKGLHSNIKIIISKMNINTISKMKNINNKSEAAGQGGNRAVVFLQSVAG